MKKCKRYTYRQDVSQTNLAFFETLKAKPSQLLKQILMPRFPRMTKVLLHVDLIFVCSVACFTEELLDEKCKYKCLREEMEVCFQELQGM